MERSNFLRALKTACKDFKASVPKESQAWLSAIVSGEKDGDDQQQLSIDKVYELLCCFSISNSLRQNVKLRLIQGIGRHKFRFPYGPGEKECFAFFRFEKDNVTYDLCCGTALSVPNGEPKEHPDISLQLRRGQVSDADRECGEVVALWDAKYHKTRAAKSDTDQMNWWCGIFDLPEYHVGDILQKILPPAFQVSSVITNAPPKPINRSVLLKRRFSVVFNFKGDAMGTLPTPSRTEHESHT